MLNSLQLHPYYRDTWGSYNAMINSLFAPLDHNPCYRPKYYEVPDVTLQNMNQNNAAGTPAYQQYTLRITPGSLILGFHNDDDSPLFTFQMTDISTGHKFQDQPISNYFVSNNDNQYPSLMTGPYPVVGSGLFMVEMWVNAGFNVNEYPIRCAFTLMVAEPYVCG